MSDDITRGVTKLVTLGAHHATRAVAPAVRAVQQRWVDANGPLAAWMAASSLRGLGQAVLNTVVPRPQPQDQDR